MLLEIKNPQPQKISEKKDLLPVMSPDANKAVSSQGNNVARKTSPSAQKPLKAQNVEEQKLEKITNALERFCEAMGVSLTFHVDNRTKDIQVVVIDPGTNKVIRKIPTDKLLDMVASMRKTMGVFIDKGL